MLKQKDQQYFLFYCGGDINSMSGVRIATSSDPLGRPGSWFKWWEGEWFVAAASCHLQRLSPAMLLHASQPDMLEARLIVRALLDVMGGFPACAAESFSQPGLGGREGEVKELGVWGGNPSVTWNSYVQRWLLTWHSWEPFDVMLSSSTDLLDWAPAVRIVVVSTLCHVRVLL